MKLPIGKYFKSFIIYLSLHFGVGLLMCFLFKCFLFEWNALTDAKDLTIFLSTIGWLSILLLLIYLIIKHFGYNHKQVFSFLLITGMAVFFISIMVSLFAIPLKFKIFNQNYIGVYSSYEYEDSEGNLKSSDKPHYVFLNDDSRIESTISSLQEERGEEISKEKFAFWQTAFAAGYDPKYIREFQTLEGSQRTVLIVTTGLLVLLECFMNSLPLAIFYLAFPILLFLIRKPFLFKDYNALKEVIEKQPK